MYWWAVFALEIVIAFFALYCERKQKNVQIVMVFAISLIFSILFLFRNSEVPDYLGYVDIFDNVDINVNYGFDWTRKHGELAVEYGFLWMMWLFKKFVGDYAHAFYFIISFFTAFLMAYAGSELIDYIRSRTGKEEEAYVQKKGINLKNKNLPILLGIYLSYFGLAYEAVAVRAGVAISLSVLFFVYFLQKKYVRMLVAFLLAFSIQRMCVLGIVIIALYVVIPRIKRSWLTVLWAVAGGLLITGASGYLMSFSYKILNMLFSNTSFLGYGHYLVEDAGAGAVDKGNIWLWLIGGVLLVYLPRLKYEEKLLNIYIIGLYVMIFSSMIPGGRRISDYFTLYNTVLLHEYYCLGEKNGFNKKLVVSGIILINCIMSFRIWGVL